MEITRRNNQVSELITRADSIKAIDVIFRGDLYPARTIKVNIDMPEWLTDYKTEGPARYMDLSLNLVMMDMSFEKRIENIGLGEIYADAIIISQTGGKVAIKDATIVHCLNLDVTLIGGVFVLVEEVNQKKIDEDQTLKKFQFIDLEE